jgi:mannose-6-phosphate isomerase-like protein (cupin superfamily)
MISEARQHVPSVERYQETNMSQMLTSIAVTQPEAWQTQPGRFAGEWQGGTYGAQICVIVNLIEEVGAGIRRHKHPYAETFVVRKGRVFLMIGDETVEGSEGQIFVVPAGVPHGFRNSGPGPLEMIDIHENGSFITEWLE